MVMHPRINPAFKELVNRSLTSSSLDAQLIKSPKTLLEFIQLKNLKKKFSEPCHITLAKGSEPFDFSAMDSMTLNSFLEEGTGKINKRLFLLAFCESQLPNHQTKQSIITSITLHEWLTTDKSRDHINIYDPTNIQPLKTINIALLDIDKVEINNFDYQLKPFYSFHFESDEYSIPSVNRQLKIIMALTGAVYDKDNEKLRNDEWMLRCLLLEGLLLNNQSDEHDNIALDKNMIEYILSFSNNKISLLTDLFNSFQNLSYDESENFKQWFIEDPMIYSIFK